MAHKQLKTFVGRTVNEAGELERVDRQVLYIETDGDLRMFMMVPDHVAGMIPEFEYRGAKMVGNRGARAYCLYGREPEVIKQGFYHLCDKYRDELLSTTVEDVIIVHLATDASHFDKAQVTLRFSTHRYHYSAKKQSHYHWRTTPGDSLRICHGVGDPKGSVRLPYTEELWAKLEGMKAALTASIERLEGIVKGSDFAQRLLAGNAVPLLQHREAK